MLSSVAAIRYVAPLREGGSLPGLVEAEDCGTYVCKFTGAGQGRKALVAEVIVGQLARALSFRVPELVLLELDPAFGRLEPDPEVQDLLTASVGTNLGVDFLPGALDLLAHPVDTGLASTILWLDAFTGNVDRSWRNPNLLLWHKEVWLIDHGAALTFHHAWDRANGAATRPYNTVDHVLAEAARDVATAHEQLAPKVTEELLRAVVSDVPDVWLADEPTFRTAESVRDAYVRHLLDRIDSSDSWLPGVAR